MTRSVKGRRRKRRKPIDPQKLAKRRQIAKVRSIFSRIGFSHISSNGVEFTFDGRTGELDDIFQQDNVIVVCEYTVGKATTGHIAPKAILFEKIRHNSEAWVKQYSSVNERFQTSIKKSKYRADEFRVRIVYVSTEGVSGEIEKHYADVRFLDGTRLRYFESLSHIIHRSARHEFFKYLKIDYSEIGDQVHNATETSRTFSGHVLPEAHSGYPAGFKLVSFYADPATLLALSYVLRQDSWRDADGLYQRILIRGKIGKMRKYLVEEKRVFVNNIIVTLPEKTRLLDQGTSKNIDASTINNTKQVSIVVPYSANMIGLVDGQHRVFCYYEGKDALEAEIAALRTRQNLLVTGLVFPEGWSANRRHEFEATLFLEINDNQARARSALKQSIELLLHPYSTTAIAKEVTNRLAARGPLSDLLQTSFFDPPSKIKTTSIVSYGLRPLLKLGGEDSLYARWTHRQKKRLADGAKTAERASLREEYVEYCVACINDFLIAAKLGTGPARWRLMEKKPDQFLTPTVLNGFFVCLRRLAEDARLMGADRYEAALKSAHDFPFSRYKSSGWRLLGDDLYEKFFGGSRSKQKPPRE